MPGGPLSKAQRNSLPYSDDFLVNINDALSQTSVEHPELVQAMQERVGCLMYATTATCMTGCRVSCASAVPLHAQAYSGAASRD